MLLIMLLCLGNQLCLQLCCSMGEVPPAACYEQKYRFAETHRRLFDQCLKSSRVLTLSACRVSCALVLLCSSGLCAVVWFLRDLMVAAFTQNHHIQQELKNVLPVVVAAIICKSLQG